jgi:hypothetical protein
MGYYENPPMIEPDRSGMIIADSILKSSEAIARGFMERGERRRQEEKENKLTIQKLQDRKNAVDLHYNTMLSNWSKETANQNKGLNDEIIGIVQQKLTLAADSQIALISETDQKKRQELLTNIRNADSFLNNSAEFGKALALQTATWREGAKALKVGVPGGFIVNGETDEQILDNTAAVEILGGMNQGYKNSSVKVTPDSQGDGVLLTVTGTHEDGRDFSVVINSKEYMSAEKAGDGGLILPVEKIDDFRAEQTKLFSNEQGMLPAYLSQVTQTVDIPSSGGDIYQYKNAKFVEEDLVKSKMKEKSDARASGVLASYPTSSLRAFVDYTLGNGPGYYDSKFKTIADPNVQKAELSRMLTDNSFDTMVKEFDRTVDKKTGKTLYWNPTKDISIKEKPKASKEEEEKEKPFTYKEEYYDQIITGLNPATTSTDANVAAYEDRTNLVQNLNKLDGNNKFVTRDEVYEMWKNNPYGDTKKTNAEQYEGDETKMRAWFSQSYPHKNGYVYKETSAGIFDPLKGYNLKSAEGRIKLALDHTSEAGERKILQKKLKDAKFYDWTKNNPRKKNETLQQYSERAMKAGF